MSHGRMARRRALALGAGGIVGLGLGPQTLIGGRKAMAQGTPETVVYVSNAGSKEVFVLVMNRATGALELIEKTPVPGTDKPSPASLPMATSPDKHFLYAQLRSEPYPVSAFAIDRTSGQLKHMAATPLVDQMAYINTDRTGKFLLAASYVGAKLAIYPINARSIVEAKATQILDTKPKAHCVVIDAGDDRQLCGRPSLGDPEGAAIRRYQRIQGAARGLGYPCDAGRQVPLRRRAQDQHADRLQDRPRQGHPDPDRPLPDREDAARLRDRPARQVPAVGRHGLGRDDGLHDRPGERRTEADRQLSDGHAAELDRDGRSEVALLLTPGGRPPWLRPSGMPYGKCGEARAGMSRRSGGLGSNGGSPKKLFSFTRYRWFESISFQRRVLCERDFLNRGAENIAEP